MGNRLSVTEGNRIGENLLDRMPQSLRFASPSMSLRSHCEAHGFAVIYTSLPRDVSPQRGFALRANFSPAATRGEKNHERCLFARNEFGQATQLLSLRSHCEAHGFAVIYTSLPRDVSPQRGFALRANFSRSLATARKTIIGVFLPEMNSGKRRNY